LKEVYIIGSGIQGCTIALELAKNNYKVILIERDSLLYNRASLRNEGKIHTGLVYMNDSSFTTPLLMLESAILFRKYLERWIGEKSYDLGLSKPFYYLVAKDSFLTSEVLEKRYKKLQSYFDLLKVKYKDWDYLGTRPENLFKKASKQETEFFFGSQEISNSFLTSELAVDTELLRKHLVEAIENNPNITTITEANVVNVKAKNRAFELTLSLAQGIKKISAQNLVNCAWDGKYKIDQFLQLPISPNLLHRLKYRVIVKLSEELMNKPSATMVIGKYGDVVNRNDGTAYLSWYPSACKGWSQELTPPEDWEKPSRGEVDKDFATELTQEIVKEIEKWYPGMKGASSILLDASPIVAYGNTDVNDSRSMLHQRSQLGFKSIGNYHSIETGKLTSAPLNAVNFVKSLNIK
jgi:hypothetical protein